MPIHSRQSDHPKFSELPMFRAQNYPLEVKDFEIDQSGSHLFRILLYSNELITFSRIIFTGTKSKYLTAPDDLLELYILITHPK